MKSVFDDYADYIEDKDALDYFRDLELVDNIRDDVLSDEDWKELKKGPHHRLVRAFLRSGNIQPHELRLIDAILEHTGNQYKHPVKYAAEWEEPVLDGYIEHIRNYAYNYKPEATNVDPNIDPSEDHVGPMAQDIEKVNPACVKTDENGVKSVDTSRLALMNAGAIAELARKIEGLK